MRLDLSRINSTHKTFLTGLGILSGSLNDKSFNVLTLLLDGIQVGKLRETHKIAAYIADASLCCAEENINKYCIFQQNIRFA